MGHPVYIYIYIYRNSDLKKCIITSRDNINKALEYKDLYQREANIWRPRQDKVIYSRKEGRQRVKTAQHIRGEIVLICFVKEEMSLGRVNVPRVYT